MTHRVKARLPGLELFCFGAPTATVGGAAPPPDVVWRKNLGLLIYLALSPDRRRSREHLIGLFWAESTQDKARRSLNSSIHRLRKRLGHDRLLCDTTTVTLNGHELDVDALRFRAAAERDPNDALRLLRGQFLEGFHVDEAPAFEEWMALERERLDRLAAVAFTSAASRELQERRLAAAVEHARRALELSPHAQGAITLLMRALFQQGDSTAALAAFRDFSDRLLREVREHPTKALSELAELIRKHADSSPPPVGGSTEPALVGREALHREVFETVSAGLAGSARTIVITGAPGMGRTRLLAECRDDGRTAGAIAVSIRPLESDHDARWSTLRQLFRAGLAEAPGLPAAPGDALAVLAALVPELATRFPARETRDMGELASALATVLGAIADEKPLLLAIDDAHWADGATIAVLHAALGGSDLKDARIVFALSVATGVGVPPVELQQLQADIARRLPGISVRLDPLRDDDVRALVHNQAQWCSGDDARDRLARRCILETGGIPFLAATLLGALQRETQFRKTLLVWPVQGRTIDEPLPFSLPDVVKKAVELRLTELSEHELAVLSAGSVGGPRLDLDLIAALTDQSRDEVEMALPALERRQLVAFDGERYSFVAPLVATVVHSACLTPGERRRLERKAADALGRRDDLESRVLRCELLARVGPTPPDEPSLALARAVAIAREARTGGASRLARRAAAAGIRIAQTAKLDATELEALQRTVESRS